MVRACRTPRRRRIQASSHLAALSAIAVMLLGPMPAASAAASKVALRWQGHTVRAQAGLPTRCLHDKAARRRMLPVRTGAWLTVISYGRWRSVSVQLGRASARGYRALGPSLGTLRRPHGRWRVTLGSVRRANVLVVEAVASDGNVARFHACVTR